MYDANSYHDIKQPLFLPVDLAGRGWPCYTLFWYQNALMDHFPGNPETVFPEECWPERACQHCIIETCTYKRGTCTVTMIVLTYIVCRLKLCREALNCPGTGISKIIFGQISIIIPKWYPQNYRKYWHINVQMDMYGKAKILTLDFLAFQGAVPWCITGPTLVVT